jgi:anhydro-N-acetylmuramic acid kinase
MNSPLFIGVLSGTSMDAIDVALVSFDNHLPHVISKLNYPIPIDFKNRCLSVIQTGQCSIDEYGTLDSIAGELFSEAILALLKHANVSAKNIMVIGSHGQTLRHRLDLKPPFSLQIGDPNIIAERTGIPTIADFRRRDIAAGGQGAPLAPALHLHIFGNAKEDRVIVNIGGISNITILPASSKTLRREQKPIIGFDTGPGNCLMDAWIQQHLSIDFDRDGRYAVSGQVHKNLLLHCLSDSYFSEKPPKSTGREYFNLPWLAKNIEALNTTRIPPQNVQATLLVLTARSIANAIENYAPEHSTVFVCGGGAHNNLLMETLAYELQRPVNSTDILGIPPDWVEAILFAWLAKQTLAGKAGNCPSVTGAKNTSILGGIFGYRPKSYI